MSYIGHSLWRNCNDCIFFLFVVKKAKTIDLVLQSKIKTEKKDNKSMNAQLLSQVLLLRYTLSDFLSWSNYLTCQLWYCSVGLHTRLQRWQTWGDNLIDNVILRSLQWDGNLAGLQNPLVPHCLMILKMDIYWNITFNWCYRPRIFKTIIRLKIIRYFCTQA